MVGSGRRNFVANTSSRQLPNRTTHITCCSDSHSNNCVGIMWDHHHFTQPSGDPAAAAIKPFFVTLADGTSGLSDLWTLLDIGREGFEFQTKKFMLSIYPRKHSINRKSTLQKKLNRVDAVMGVLLTFVDLKKRGRARITLNPCCVSIVGDV